MWMSCSEWKVSNHILFQHHGYPSGELFQHIIVFHIVLYKPGWLLNVSYKIFQHEEWGKRLIIAIETFKSLSRSIDRKNNVIIGVICIFFSEKGLKCFSKQFHLYQSHPTPQTIECKDRDHDIWRWKYRSLYVTGIHIWEVVRWDIERHMSSSILILCLMIRGKMWFFALLILVDKHILNFLFIIKHVKKWMQFTSSFLGGI